MKIGDRVKTPDHGNGTIVEKEDVTSRIIKFGVKLDEVPDSDFMSKLHEKYGCLYYYIKELEILK